MTMTISPIGGGPGPGRGVHEDIKIETHTGAGMMEGANRGGVGHGTRTQGRDHGRGVHKRATIVTLIGGEWMVAVNENEIGPRTWHQDQGQDLARRGIPSVEIAKITVSMTRADGTAATSTTREVITVVKRDAMTKKGMGRAIVAKTGTTGEECATEGKETNGESEMLMAGMRTVGVETKERRIIMSELGNWQRCRMLPRRWI
jgi:hypothetical protein